MRKPRFTFIGAFHHVMNRGHNRSIIFPTHHDKIFFINLIRTRASLLRIKILAYVIMDNHYHIILQNTSGKLSKFMQQVNSIYATYFRKKYGGSGYVFTNRFKSTLIENNSYLLTAIIYTLFNPVRANITLTPYFYTYSSIHEYFSGNYNSVTDIKFVEELFKSKKNLMNSIINGKELKIKNSKSRMGEVMGGKNFIKKAIEIYDRRKERRIDREKQRKDERPFKKYKDIIKKYEITEEIELKKIDIWSIKGKKKRRKLLKLLREDGGFTYKQINRLTLYKDLKLTSLRVLYKREKENTRFNINY